MPKGKAPRTELERLRRRPGVALSQDEVADAVSDLLGESISQATISGWERGTVDYTNVHPARLRAYATVLRISTDEMERLIGLPSGALSLGDRSLAAPAPYIPEEVPEGLLEAGRRYGDDYSELREPSWIGLLVGHRGRDFDGPETAKEWLEYFLDVRKHTKPRRN